MKGVFFFLINHYIMHAKSNFLKVYALFKTCQASSTIYFISNNPNNDSAWFNNFI